MIANRQWISLCLAGLCWGGIAVAQDAGGASGGSSGASGGASGGSSAGSGASPSGADSSGTPSSGTKGGAKGKDGGSETPAGGTPADAPTPGGAPPPKTGGSVDPFAPTAPKTTDQSAGANGPGASSAFGGQPEKKGETGPGFTTPGEVEPPADAPSGQSSAFGPGDSTATTQPAPPSFTLPGFFGGGPSTYTGGQGRLARPRFRYKVTVSQGYDDNVLQTPNDPQRFPDQQILVDPGTPDTVTFVPVTTIVGYVPTFAGPIIHYEPVLRTTIERRVIRGRAPVIRTIRAPDPQERTGSLVSRVGLKFDTQQVTRRSLFTLDLSGSVDHFWDRPGIDGSDDYSGSLTLAYVYNFTPRLSTSVTANIAYISQPDFTRINTPDRLSGGDLVNGLARLNMTYRWTPRFTTVFSMGENVISFVNQKSTAGAAANGDSYETTFSAEGRYLWKPRYTLLAEFRHVLINYPDTSSLNSTTDVLLVGAELRLSSRLSATVRLGEAIRIFDESGDSSSSPYGEALLTYRVGPTSNFQWNSRFGYEEPPGVGSQVLSYRTTLSYSKSFTPRLSLTTGITGVSRNISFRGADDETEQTVDANIGLEYRFSRQLTLNATFSFTKIITTSGFRDYDRSRIFIGAEYEF